MFKIYFKSIDNLMKYLLFELKIRNMPITKFRMLKFIYKIKMELGNDFELSNKLPYYWYHYGPYSNMVDDSWKVIKSKCDVRYNSVILKDKYMKEFNNKEFISKYHEIEDIAYNILKDRTSFYSSLEKDIYKDYAPLSIMYSFKFDIYDIANNYRTIDSFNSDEYVKTVCMCEGKLPNDNYYDKFNDLFSDFITNLDLINEEHNLHNCWLNLRFTIIELWKTFTDGVRVQFHDEAYDEFDEIWDLKFQNSLKELSVLINKTERFINIDFGNIPYSDSEKTIINSTIGSYLRR